MEIKNNDEKVLNWIPEDVSERDWDGGHTNYTQYKCPKCGHTEAYKKTPYCSSCGSKMKV